MKNFLRITVACMAFAGTYGFADLIHDAQNGTLIQYSKEEPVASSLALHKGQPPRTTLENALATEAFVKKENALKAEKKKKDRLKLSDLNVESFSRGEVFIPEPEDSTIVASAATDSIIKKH